MALDESKKKAKTDVDVLKEIEERWSTRAFSDQSVELSELKQLFEAARWAASSFNGQPWRFIVGQKGDQTYDKLFDCLMEWNQGWNKSTPVLVAGISKKTFAEHTPSAGKDNFHSNYDLGQSVAFLTLQATKMGLYVHQMAGFDWKAVKDKFNLSDDYHPAVMFSIGHRTEPEILDEEYRESEYAERTRLPLSEIVFTGEFGKPLFD
ncbi:MAG: nitroreductase family protein [Bacteroidota bacterium]